MNNKNVRIVVDVTNMRNGAKQMIVSLPLDEVLIRALTAGEAMIVARSPDTLLEISIRPIQ